MIAPSKPASPCPGSFPAALLALLLSAVPLTAAASPEPSASARKAAELVIAQLASDDADLRSVALETVRHGLKGDWFTRMAAERVPALDPSGRSALLLALADRGDPGAVPAAVASLTGSPEPATHAAALRLLGRLGGRADVATLTAATTTDGPVGEAARRGLVEISGGDAAAAIREAVGSGPAAKRAIVIDVLAERRDRAALPAIAAAAIADDQSVRQASLRALARLGGAAEVPTMVQSLVKSAADERKNAELAIAAVCTTSAEASRATDSLLEQYRAADKTSRALLLPALARVGGPRVLAIVDAMLADPAQRAAALDALSKWPDAGVKDRLLDLLARATDPEERELLLGTLIRIAPLPDNKLKDDEKLALLKQTMGLCRRAEDKARVLERANAIRTIETFRFVSAYLDDPVLAEPACRSVVELAHHQKLRDAHKAEFTAALDKVLRTTKDEELLERAARYKAGRTWDRKQKG